VSFVFKCKWVDSNISVRIDDFGFTLVDLKKLAYQNESFIMETQAKQGFYVQDPCDERWSLILYGKTISPNIEDDDSTIDTCLSPFCRQMLTNINKEEVDEILANRNDHDERELINII